jgi:E3 ubiquitin-protein ligase BRE1
MNLFDFVFALCHRQPNVTELVARLERDLSSQDAKCSSFIQEVESLSVMFGDLEAENARLVRLMTEKESVLSKVMSEKLRGRQQLATMKEEARSLAQGREIDQEKMKNLAGQVSASKRAASEAASAASKASEEVRLLSQQVGEQRKIAEDALVSMRAAQSEKDAMRMERDAAVSRAEQLQVGEHVERFEVKRLLEEKERLTRELSEASQALQRAQRGAASSVGHSSDVNRDEIIQELMKKLHCSVVTHEPKEVALTRCGHMMSRQCVSQLIAGRSRKCPLCGIAFSESDVLNVYLD